MLKFTNILFSRTYHWDVLNSKILQVLPLKFTLNKQLLMPIDVLLLARFANFVNNGARGIKKSVLSCKVRSFCHTARCSISLILTKIDMIH